MAGPAGRVLKTVDSIASCYIGADRMADLTAARHRLLCITVRDRALLVWRSQAVDQDTHDQPASENICHPSYSQRRITLGRAQNFLKLLPWTPVRPSAYRRS
jgi:hypothetical protein